MELHGRVESLNGLEQIKNLFYKFLDNYSYQELYPFLFGNCFHCFQFKLHITE